MYEFAAVIDDLNTFHEFVYLHLCILCIYICTYTTGIKPSVQLYTVYIHMYVHMSLDVLYLQAVNRFPSKRVFCGEHGYKSVFHLFAIALCEKLALPSCHEEGENSTRNG